MTGWAAGGDRPGRVGGNPRNLGPSLDRLARALGAPDAGTLATLFARWDEIAGAQVSAHAWPMSLVDGTLLVGVDEPAWATHLKYLEADLRDRLDNELGAGRVTRVELRIRPR